MSSAEKTEQLIPPCEQALCKSCLLILGSPFRFPFVSLFCNALGFAMRLAKHAMIAGAALFLAHSAHVQAIRELAVIASMPKVLTLVVCTDVDVV